MTFKEKVQSLSAKEIILSMTDALKIPPIIKIRMNSYGDVEEKKGFLGLFKKKFCVGCAATNTICKIGNIKFTTGNIGSLSSRASALGETASEGIRFVDNFETAINFLRQGDIDNYNYCADNYEFSKIAHPEGWKNNLPTLEDDYTNEQLIPYIKLAEAQP